MFNPAVGVNLNVIAQWNSNLPFLDLYKQSDLFIFEPESGWYFNEDESLLDVDEFGWIESLPIIDGQVQPVMAAVLWHEWHPTGRYIIEYEGEGTLEVDGEPIASQPGRIEVELGSTEDGIPENLQLYLLETDPNGTGDYIRNIRVFRSEDEALIDRGEIFRPEYLEKVEDFRTFRYMDWLHTNFSPVKEWDNAQQSLEKARYHTLVPYEAIVELANQTKTDAWINIPHQASDDFIRSAAAYVRDRVDPDLRIYVEYTNEFWTDGFDQKQYLIDRGKSLLGQEPEILAHNTTAFVQPK